LLGLKEKFLFMVILFKFKKKKLIFLKKIFTMDNFWKFYYFRKKDNRLLKIFFKLKIN